MQHFRPAQASQAQILAITCKITSSSSSSSSSSSFASNAAAKEEIRVLPEKSQKMMAFIFRASMINHRNRVAPHEKEDQAPLTPLKTNMDPENHGGCRGIQSSSGPWDPLTAQVWVPPSLMWLHDSGPKSASARGRASRAKENRDRIKKE